MDVTVDAQGVIEYVYVMSAAELDPVKIGRSVNPQIRKGALQTGAPARLEILWTTPGGYDLESRLHARFRAYRTYGEWFDLTPLGDPVAVIQEAVRDIQGGSDVVVPRRRDTDIQSHADAEVDSYSDPPVSRQYPPRPALSEAEAASQLVLRASDPGGPVMWSARFATPEELARFDLALPDHMAVPVLISQSSHRDELGRIIITEEVHPPGTDIPVPDDT